MTLTELRYIVALARERHFGRAAERCHVSQPTLSVAVKKLEERLEVLLFERTPGDIRLTPVGERVCAQAEKVLAEAARVEELAQLGKDPLVGPLRLGVIYTIAPYLLPRLIPALHRLAPRMPLYLQENFTHRLAEALKSGELDAAIVAAPFEEPGIVTRALYDEPFEVALPAQHPLAGREAIAKEEIDPSQLLILGQGNCFRDQVVSACPQLTAPGKIEQAVEGSSLETMRHMVASGAGIAVVPASASATWPKDDPLFVIRPFQSPAPSRRVVLAWRVTFPRPQAMDVLYQAVCQAPPTGTRFLK
ncbi:MAG: hydrogen peroxide-inducible genes activator [Azovibrio sp.]|nr:hydrogen peroxide-inducible genes activator [Azovibrio sp.]